MSRAKKTILFVTPGASLVGGNIFFFNFLKWFKEHTNIPFILAYDYGGELEAEYKKLCPTFKFGYDWSDEGFSAKSKNKVLEKLAVRERRNAALIKKHNIALIYSNAVTNHKILSRLYDINAPLVAHCHELESAIHRNGLDKFQLLAKHTDHFVAASAAVRANLIEKHDIPGDMISVMHEFIPIFEVSDEERNKKKALVRKKLGIPENAFVVGGSGTLYWRKAPEIFIQIAARAHKQRPDLPIYFVWIGGAAKGDFSLYEARFDVEKLGLDSKVHFLEHQKNPQDYMCALDAFALTSREDPYPLVCLEAASIGMPVTCFADSGGMPEFVEEDCGFVVPYLDTNAFAGRIIELSENENMARNFADNAREKVRIRHDIVTCAPRMTELIEQHLT